MKGSVVFNLNTAQDHQAVIEEEMYCGGSSNTHDMDMQQQQQQQQQQRVMLERKRREKLNESFHILRFSLPSAVKKDKATVLSAATDYLTCLKAQISELTKKNQTLELQHATVFPADQPQQAVVSISDSSIVRCLDFQTPRGMRMIDLQVIRSEDSSSSMVDMVISLLELLKQDIIDQRMSLISIDATTTFLDDSSPAVNRLIFRLQINAGGAKWEESEFQEAITKALNHITHQ